MYNNIVRALAVLAVMLIAATMSNAQGSEASLPIERLSSPNADDKSVWTYAWGSAEPNSETTCQAIAFDPQNRALYVAGSSRVLSTTEGSSTGENPGSVYFARCTTEGTPVWTRTWQSDEPGLSIESIAVDSDGEIYFSGTAPPGFHFRVGSGPDVIYGDFAWRGPSADLVKMTSDGEIIWSKQWCAGTAGSVRPTHISVADDGDIIVAGYYSGDMDIAALGTFSSGESSDTFVMAFSPEGEPRWFNQVVGAGTEGPAGVCTDRSGNVYVTGTWSKPLGIMSSTGSNLAPDTSLGITFDEQNMSSIDSNLPPVSFWNDVCVLSIDIDGKPRWLKAIQPLDALIRPDISMGIVTKGDGIVAVMGCRGVVTQRAVAYATLNLDGDPVNASHLLGSNESFLPAGIHMDASGTLVVTGELEGRRTFQQAEPGENAPQDTQDIWCLELSNDRASITAGYSQLPSNAWVSLNSSALDPEGFLYLAGNSGNRGWLACMKFTP